MGNRLKKGWGPHRKNNTRDSLEPQDISSLEKNLQQPLELKVKLLSLIGGENAGRGRKREISQSHQTVEQQQTGLV